MTRRCPQCGDFKSHDQFRKGKSKCKSCLNFNRQQWAEANPQSIKRYRQRYQPDQTALLRKRRETIIGRAKSLMQGVRSRVSQSSGYTDLTWQIIYALMIIQRCKCAQTGIEFDFSFSTNGRTLACPSIDKIDPNGEYTIDNIQIVCWFYNVAKGRWSDEHIWSMMREAIAYKGDR